MEAKEPARKWAKAAARGRPLARRWKIQVSNEYLLGPFCSSLVHRNAVINDGVELPGSAAVTAALASPARVVSIIRGIEHQG
jgi:hypothetical protein